MSLKTSCDSTREGSVRTAVADSVFDAEKGKASQPGSHLEHASVPCTSTPEFPDGGLQAWSVVLGAYLALFSTFGVINAYGVFQDYYQTTLLKESSPSTISLIGALQLFLLYGLGPVIGRIFDVYGSRVIMPLGSVIAVFAMMMVSLGQENQIWQFFLSQGVLFGIGISLVFTPALAVIGHWFQRKRAFAIGIVASGSSLGGVIYPIMLQELIPLIGFGWAVRVAAFTMMLCLVVSCLTLRTRLPLRGRVHISDMVDLEGFKDPRYALLGAGAFLLFYALFTPYFYVEIYADFRGMSKHISKYLLAILNVFGIISRVVPGKMADRLGPMNILLPCTIMSGVLCLCLWLPAKGEIPIIVFTALYGFFSGAAISLIPSYIASISPMDKHGARFGSIYMLVAISTLVGTPTAGAFVSTIDEKHFQRLIIFTGVLAIAGGSVLSVARLLHSRHIMFKA
ncbi:MFS general substrate transporter [Neolentinus lepideus HHB14362 ss-1]|uniref:MFS general substrate transporter n=1 Tax=Neolentinus lepideus HHB14362 ss-1 TaxID=1314782 RepID=A0A165NW54_9AGAM|nr:MFS general substrate transporter [Neolentinus lepideus HHB14362 ss-1]